MKSITLGGLLVWMFLIAVAQCNPYYNHGKPQHWFSKMKVSRLPAETLHLILNSRVKFTNFSFTCLLFRLGFLFRSRLLIWFFAHASKSRIFYLLVLASVQLLHSVSVSGTVVVKNSNWREFAIYFRAILCINAVAIHTHVSLLWFCRLSAIKDHKKSSGILKVIQQRKGD